MRIRIFMQELICASGLENRGALPYRFRMGSIHPFTANIRALIAAAPNQTEFAEQVDVSQGTISRWLDGTIPKMETVEKVAGRLGVTVSELMEGQVGAPRPTTLAPVTATVMLPVLLPNEETLTRMFETSLEKLVAPDRVDEIARTLAQRLPVDLQHALSPLPARVRDEALAPAASTPKRAKRQQRDQPESHT